MEIPSHPETDETAGDRQAAPGNRVAVVLVAVVIGLLALLVILHLTGVVGPTN